MICFMSCCHDLTPGEEIYLKDCCLHTVPGLKNETEVHARRARFFGCCCCVKMMHRGYRVLRRMHMFGLRVATKPCLQ